MPSLMPAGILTSSVLFFLIRPWPLQVVQGSGMILPVPWQCGQVCWMLKKPWRMCTVPVSLTTAALGGGINVPTLGGSAEIDLPEGTQHGKTFRLRGKGIKGIRSSYPGDLYCHITVETPVKLTEHQRKLLKELDESFRKSGDRHSPNAKSWTDRVKDLFK